MVIFFFLSTGRGSKLIQNQIFCQSSFTIDQTENRLASCQYSWQETFSHRQNYQHLSGDSVSFQTALREEQQCSRCVKNGTWLLVLCIQLSRVFLKVLQCHKNANEVIFHLHHFHFHQLNGSKRTNLCYYPWRK